MIVENIEDKDLLTIEIDDEIGADSEIIGTFVKNSAKLSIQNLNHQYDDFKDKYITIKGFGSWYVNDLINSEDFTEADLSLYDISNKFDEEYNDELYSFPCTLGEWATKIGDNVGIPLKGTFLNYDLEIEEAPYLGTDPAYKDAIKFISKYASGYAQVNRDDTYSIKWFDSTTYEIEDWESFAHGNESNEVNKVVLSTGDTGDNECWPQVEPTDPYEIKIVDDWTNIERTEIIENIYNQLKGFKYTTITKLDVPYGLLELRAGQMIKVQDVELKDITTYISGHKLSWDGGDFDDPNSWSSSITMSEISETSTKHSYSESLTDKIKRTERTVDKQNQIIQDVVEKTENVIKETTITKQASGNPIEINDAGEYPLESIGIEGKSYQEDTPTPDNPQDIQTVKGVTNYLNNELVSQTINGVTIEVDDKGIITCNGTATAQVTLTIAQVSLIPNERNRLSGCPSGGSATTYELLCTYNGTTYRDRGTTAAFDVETSTTVNVNLVIRSGCKCNDLIFKPMLTLASDDYRKYVPYGRYLEQITFGKNRFSSELVNAVTNDSTGLIGNTNTTRLSTSTLIETEDIEQTLSCAEGNIKFACYAFDKYGALIGLVDSSNPWKTSPWTYSPPEGTKYVRYTFGKDDNSNISLTDVTDIQLEFGNTQTEYEEYEENTALINLNKDNLFDKDNANILKAYLSTTNIVSESKSGVLYIPCEINTTYSIEKIVSNSFSVAYTSVLPEIGGSITGRILNTSADKITITTNSVAKYLVIQYLTSSDSISEDDILDSIKIYEGYEPYFELAEVNDIKDYFLDGSLTKKVEKLVLTGDESFAINNLTFQTSNIVPSNLGSRMYGICSHYQFEYHASAISTNLSNNSFGWNADNHLTIRDDNYTTVADFKAFLKEQYEAGTPVIVYYVLAEPKTYELEYETLQLHQGYNYITLNDELYPDMDITYLTDSSLNAVYATQAQLTIESNKIASEVSSQLEDYATFTEIDAIVEEKVDEKSGSITSSLTGTFATKSDVETAQSNAISSANASTDAKLKEYSTTTTMNNAITQSISDSASSILASVSAIYETIEDAEAKVKEINGQLELKVGTDDYNQIVSMLNAAADIIHLKGKRFIVESDLLTLTANDTEILKIPISVDYDFTQDDIDKAYDYIMGRGTLTDEELEKYDVTGDGKVNTADVAKMFQIVRRNISKSKPGYIKMVSNGIFSNISLVDGDGNNFCSLNLDGISTKNLTVNESATIDTLTVGESATINNITINSDGQIVWTDYPDYNSMSVRPLRVYSASASTVSTATGTQINLCNITIPQGYYIGVARVWITGNSSGYRVIGVTGSTGTAFNSTNKWATYAASSAGVGQSILLPFVMTAGASGETIKLWGYQTSGSTLNMSAYIYAYLLK